MKKWDSQFGIQRKIYIQSYEEIMKSLVINYHDNNIKNKTVIFINFK